MMQSKLLQKDLSKVGEEISHELGSQMIKDYQTANPTEAGAFFIGKDILEKILAQPGSVGIRYFNGYNEAGEKTLVYLAVDENFNDLLEYNTVNKDGKFETEKGIVADRSFWIDWLLGNNR